MAIETNETTPVPADLESFVDTVLDDIKGHQAVLMGCLGDRLGLFEALSAEPATSRQLAERTGLNERYVREWLSGMTAAGYLVYEPDTKVFRLTPDQAEVFVREAGPASLGGLFEEMPAMWAVFDEVADAFRQGGGVHLDAYGNHWWDGMERFTRAWFENFLLEEWIPRADGVEERLSRGAHVADVGCGRGRALIELATAFPGVTGVGYDLSDAQLEGARRNAREAEVSDRLRFERRDVVRGLDDTFDLVTTFDAAHDLADPDAVFRQIREALRDGGSYLLLDFDVAERLEDNVGRNGTMFYGWSLMYCMTTAMARGGEGLGTCGLPESEVRRRCLEAGFSSVHVVPFDDPFNVLYQARV